MSIELIFTSSSQPLSEMTVRLEDGRERTTDESGRLKIDLQPGRRRFEIRIGDQWIETSVEIESGDESRVVDIEKRGPAKKLSGEDSIEIQGGVEDTGRAIDKRRRESPSDIVGGRTSGSSGDDPPVDRRPARPPGDELPGRDPDFTGASGSDEVEWDRPVARVARIVAVIALVFGLVVLIHFLFFAGSGEETQPVESQHQEVEQVDEGDEDLQ